MRGQLSTNNYQVLDISPKDLIRKLTNQNQLKTLYSGLRTQRLIKGHN